MDQGGDRHRHRRPRAFYAGIVEQLLDFAEAELRLSKRQKDGATLRDHLESGWSRSGGPKPKALDTPELPTEVGYIWSWFTQLSLERRRDPIEGRPERLSSTEIRNWCYLERIALQPFELVALRRLDAMFVDPPPLTTADEEEDDDD